MPVTSASEGPQIGFVHIPKCGGTSLETALGISNAYPELGLKKTRTEADHERLFGAGLQHLSVRELCRNHNDKWDALATSFTVIRNPLDRLVSHLLWRVSRFSTFEGTDGELIDHLKHLLDEVEARAQRGTLFQNPLIGHEYDHTDPETVQPNDMHRHLLPQSCFVFYDGNVPIQRIFLLDRMDDLEATLDREGFLQMPVEQRMARGSHRDFSERVPDDLRAWAARLYRYDYEMFDFVTAQSEQSSDGYCSGGALERFMGDCSARQGADSRSAIAPPSFRRPTPSQSVPRKLWMYWHQGWETAPDLVKHCRRSWVQKNPGWEMNFLSGADLGQFVSLPEFYRDNQQITFTSLSDVIRVHLLAEHGGVWADATTWCARPLDEWVDRCAEPSGFFAFAKPAADRPIASWFLAAHKESAMIATYRSAVDNVWRQFATGHGFKVHDALFNGPRRLRRAALAGTLETDRPNRILQDLFGLFLRKSGRRAKTLSSDPMSHYYFWFHETFAALLETDEAFAQAWQDVVEVSADGPHVVQRAGMCAPMTAETELHISNVLSNLYKLNRREDVPTSIEGTSLEFLIMRDQTGAKSSSG